MLQASIQGLRQVALIELHLDVKDAILLDWLTGFMTSGNMEMRIVKGIPYYWVYYKAVLQKALPILDISSPIALRRRFKHYEDIGIMESYLYRKTKTYYRLTPLFYEMLVAEPKTMVRLEKLA